MIEKELKKIHRTRISFILICSILLNYVTLNVINNHYPRQKEMDELQVKSKLGEKNTKQITMVM